MQVNTPDPAKKTNFITETTEQGRLVKALVKFFGTNLGCVALRLIARFLSGLIAVAMARPVAPTTRSSCTPLARSPT